MTGGAAAAAAATAVTLGLPPRQERAHAKHDPSGTRVKGKTGHRWFNF